MAAPLPLDGLKVVDLTWVVAGPAIGRVLADYGATVVHVETSRRVDTARVVGPFHDGVAGPERSALYGNMNAGKLGLALDLSYPEARDVVRDLARWADVLTEAFSPGVMQRWELDYERLRAINPSLVMLSTCLMGQTGPYATYAGYGNTGASMSGFQNMVGWADRPPLGPLGPYTDYVGPRFALVTLLAALDHRRRTGEGCYIDHSQSESGMQFLAPTFVDYFATGRVAERDGNRDAGMSPNGAFPCAVPEGRRESWVAISARSDEEWRRLANMIGGEILAADPRFATLADRKRNEDELEALLAAWTASQSAADVEALLQQHGIPAHLVATTVDAVADPQLRHRGHFVELEHPIYGRTTVEGSRYKLSRTPVAIMRAAPTYGRDNHDVLSGILGYDDEHIAALSASGALE